MARKLTARFLGDESGPSKGALPPAGKPQIDHRDSVAPGLIVRVTKGGRRSFVVWYRFNREARRDTLRPSYPALSLDEAREEARETARDVAAGRDPRLSGRAPRSHYTRDSDSTEPQRPETYREAVLDYVKRVQRGQEANKTADEVERALLRVGGRRLERQDGTREYREYETKPHWLDKPIADISARDVRRELEAIRDGDEERKPAPYSANRTFAYLRTFFAWCEEPGVEKVSRSPVTGLKKPWSGEEARARWFSDAEIARLWSAADTLPQHSGALVKLLILTGKRKSAIASMRWQDIADDGMWTPPQDRRRKRGNKRTHPVPLPSLALRIVRSLPRVKGNPYVFPGRYEGRHLEPGATVQRAMADRAEIPDFHFHAIRHTVETQLGELGVSPHVRDMLLDHAPMRGAGAGYDHYSYRKELTAAVEDWSGHVQSVLRKHGAWAENVEPLRG